MRPAFDALFDIDDVMADVVARSTQPALAAIKLAWWRERLEELDAGNVPAEPRLKAAAAELLPRGVGGAELAGLEEGWAGLLHDPPEVGLVSEHGARLFAIGARLLGVDFQYETIGVAGSLFAKIDAARRGLTATAAPSVGRGSMRIPRRARALTGLAALAVRDFRRGEPPFEAEATPGRAWTLLRHRLTGHLPR